MSFVLAVIAWCVLFILAWPLALLAIVLLPLLWLLSLPFRVLGVLVEALLAFIKAVLFLPARILGTGDSKSPAPWSPRPASGRGNDEAHCVPGHHLSPLGEVARSVG